MYSFIRLSPASLFCIGKLRMVMNLNFLNPDMLMYEAIILLNDRNLFSLIKLTSQFMYYQQFILFFFHRMYITFGCID